MPFNITVIQVYAPTSNAEEAEVEQFYEDLQDLLELPPKKDVLFITGDWNAKVESQEIPGLTGKFGLGVQNEAGQRLTEFCQQNALVIANTLFQQHKRRLYTWALPDGQHQNQTDTTLMPESEEELKSLLMKVKEESEKADLKLSLQETKIMTSNPIASWQIDGKPMETMTDFLFLASKITADGD